MFRSLRVWLIVLVLVMTGAAVVAADWWFAFPLDTPKSYVGGGRCMECHQAEHRAWQGSHHDLAMDLPTPRAVRGDFDDAEFDYHGSKARFFQKDGRYFVSTDGPDGKLHDYEVKYTFGWTPLQQYLVELDGGHLQVLPFCWDVNKREWFHIYRDDPRPITADDPLHWTGRLQNWNYMCAECHSTDLRKNFDVAKNEYHTQFTDIDVSCEACHGPGSMHVDLAENKLFFWDRNHGFGLPRLKAKDATAELEACARCHSHKRTMHDGFHPGRKYADHFVLSGIDDAAHIEPLYYPDGQIHGEVYELGSFQQSLMFRKGVRCTDCHDPHALTLKRDGNSLCTECHVQAKYDTPVHHHHLQGGEGSKCVECHMPQRTYMVVDPRRDHSLRIPRPDLSLKLGTPNSCTDCHLKKDPANLQRDEYQDWLAARDDRHDHQAAEELKLLDEWAAKAVEGWYDDKHRRDEHYGLAIAAGREAFHSEADRPAETESDAQAAQARRDETVQRLIRLARNKEAAGPVVRASAVSLLGAYSTRDAWEANVSFLSDADSQVRLRAVANLEPFYSPAAITAWREKVLPPEASQQLQDQYEQLLRHGGPRLSDTDRSVRIEAARVLSIVPRRSMTAADREAFAAALDEFIVGQQAVDDEPATHLNLGVVWANLRAFDKAEAAYLQGIALDRRRRFAPIRINLALLYNFLERKQDAERLLREAVGISAGLHALEPRASGEYATASYYLGLRLLDQADADEGAQPQAAHQRRAEAALYLAKAVDLVPEDASYRNMYVETLLRLNRVDDARRVLRRTPQGEKAIPQYLYAIIVGHLKTGQFRQALPYAELRAQLLPQDAQAQEDYRAIRERVSSSPH